MKQVARPLTTSEVEDIRRALQHARAGRGSLKELAHAHELASDQGGDLPFTLGELRDHIRRMTPSPRGATEAKSVILGIISGIITWAILGRRDENDSGARHHLAGRGT